MLHRTLLCFGTGAEDEGAQGPDFLWDLYYSIAAAPALSGVLDIGHFN